MYDAESVVGVAIGRFQVDDLHEGHRYLLDTIQSYHQNLCVVIGSTGGLPTEVDPLPYPAVAALIKETYPSVTVLQQFDHPLSSDSWSRALDQKLRVEFPGKEIILYGSRDSFIPHYSGELRTVEIPERGVASGTKRRAQIEFPHTLEGRQALIHAARTRYPINYRTVDLAIIDAHHDRVLMIGKRVHDGLVSFVGGYNDRKGETDRAAALREKDEEVPGVEIGPLTLLDTLPINDPRYRRSGDGVVTTLFSAPYKGGKPEAGDDADYVLWVKRTDLLASVVPWHEGLAEIVLANWPYPWYRRLMRWLTRAK